LLLGHARVERVRTLRQQVRSKSTPSSAPRSLK
jgi:hypothetical protein